MAAELMPRDWALANPTTPRGNFWPGYYRCYVPSTSLISLTGAGGPVRNIFDTARLGDGYSSGVKTRAASATHNGASDLSFSGWLWWPNEITAGVGTVHYHTAHFQNNVVNAAWPSARQYHTGGAGVIARASGWSFATDSVGGITHTHCLNGTCYFFGFVQDHSGGDTNAMFALFKYTGGGSRTTLATLQIASPWTEYIGTPWTPHALQIISVDLSGTSTRLNCRVGIWNDAQGDFTWTTIFSNHTDTSSPLQGTTRSGFVLSGDSQLGLTGAGSTGLAVAPGCTSFLVGEGASGSNIVFADNFRRRERAQGQGVPISTSSAYFYAAGPHESRHFDLCSAFSGDEFSAEGNAPGAMADWHMLTPETLGGGAFLSLSASWNDPENYESVPSTYTYSGLGGDPGTEYGYMMSRWYAEERWTQHRKVTLNFTGYTQGPAVATDYSGDKRRWCGLVIRSAGAEATDPDVNGELNTRLWPGQGYEVLLGCSEGSAFPQGQIRVYRRTISAGGDKELTLLAYANVTCTKDKQYDLEAECYTQQDASSNPIGNVVLRVYYGETSSGTSFVTLIKAASAPAGVEVLSGSVVDGTSERILLGYGEGLRMWCPYLVNGPCSSWRAWSQLDLQTGGPSGGVNPEDQVAWAVSTETDGATGTFASPYEFAVEATHDAPTLRHSYESGHRYAGRRYLDSRRVWRIGGTVNGTELTALRNFWASHDGSVIGFDFENPDDSAETVVAHFVKDSLIYELVDRDQWSYSVEIEELFSQ